MRIEDETYEKSYKRTLAMLELDSQTESFNLQKVIETLKALYQYEALDWAGRGEIKNAEISGSISAYQVFIHNHKNKEFQNQN
ncbi:MAG: hypothetical protein JEY99_09755 [Spirochaetales bacterium]|nr:hypothetical protein [Spirochaetales bacterium]